MRDASAEGNVDEIKSLLFSGLLDIDCGTGCYKETALFAATNQGHKHVVQFLLDRGANPSEADGLGYTPLHMAVGGNNSLQPFVADLVKLLLGFGADPNMAAEWGTTKGTTPLHVVVSYGSKYMRGREDVVQLLMSKGADPEKANEIGETPLSMAHKMGLMNIVNILNCYEEQQTISSQ